MRTVTKFALMGVAAIAFASTAVAQQIKVEANKTTALRINGEAASVVIGNPRVADVSVHDEKLIFITGRTFGTTNLMVFSTEGRQLYIGDVVVTANTSNLVSVNRAGSTNTYDCAPRCRSVLAIGDDSEYFDVIVTQNQDLQSLATTDN